MVVSAQRRPPTSAKRGGVDEGSAARLAKLPRGSELSAPMRRHSRVWVELVVSALMLAGPAATWASPATKAAPEHEVKAEFIERFTRFVTWPDSAFASASSAFVVCAWGGGALASQLERVVARRRIKDRPVRMLHVTSRDELEPCHILYVAAIDRAVVRGIIASTHGKPILSVGDQPGLAADGLLINLFLDDEGFVRFEINREAADASGLKISAKLMRLARLVGIRR